MNEYHTIGDSILLLEIHLSLYSSDARAGVWLDEVNEENMHAFFELLKKCMMKLTSL